MTTVQDDYGQLERRDGKLVLRFTRRLPHPPEKVWRALTEPEHLEAWFPTTIEGDRAAGARLRFSFRENEGEPFEGEMLACDPPSLMELRWGDETLRFELQPDLDSGGAGSAAGTVLRFAATFDEQQIGKLARDGAGWHASLDLLVHEVDGKPAPWSAPERWKQVHGSYVENLGPEASTIGPPEEWERVHGST